MIDLIEFSFLIVKTERILLSIHKTPYMENLKTSFFNKNMPDNFKETKLLFYKTVSQSEFTYVKSTPSSESTIKCEELFNAFTADIIKKETLFTR